MKKILSILAAGAAFVATPALACEFTGQNQVPVGALLGDASATGAPVAVGQLVGAFWGQPRIRAAFESAGCSQEQFVAQAITLNGGNPNALLARSVNFIYPTPAAPAPAQPAPAASATPVAQATATPAPVTTASAVLPPVPAAAPKAVPATPVVAAPLAVKPLPARVDMTDVWGAINALKADDEKLRAAIAEKSPEQVTAQDRTVIKQLNAIPNWEEALKKLGATGEVETAKLPAEQQAVVQQVIAAKSLAESYLGRDTLDGMTVVNSIFTLLLVILAAFGIRAWRNRDKDIATAAQSAVDDALADVRLDDTFKLTVLADISGLQADVTGLKSRFKHDVRKAADTLEPAEMKALADGEEFEYHLLVDRLPVSFDAKVVQHTPAGDALIKVDELPDLVTAKNLRGELADYFEKGGALPVLKLVNTP